MDAKQNGYVESFFNSPTDIYIRNQQIVKVDKKYIIKQQYNNIVFWLFIIH